MTRPFLREGLLVAVALVACDANSGTDGRPGDDTDGDLTVATDDGSQESPRGTASWSAPEPPLEGADLQLVMTAERALSSNAPETVESILAPLLARPRPPAKALFDAGWADYNLKQYGSCIERMERALQLDPSLAAHARVLGFAHYKLGAHAAASRVFAAIVEARPDAYKSHYGLALVALTEGELTAASEHLETSQSLKADYLKAQHLQARLLSAEGRPAEALPVVEAVIARQPSHEEALYLLSQILAELGRDEEAEAAAARWRRVYDMRDRIAGLDRSLRAGRADPALVIAMAEEFESIGDRAEALRVLREGLRRFGGTEELVTLFESLGGRR